MYDISSSIILLPIFKTEVLVIIPLLNIDTVVIVFPMFIIAVMPLSNKLNEEAKKVFDMVHEEVDALFDTTGSIGKRYRREDAIGTPLCVTFDFQSLEDHMVTVRERDSMSQERVKIDELNSYIHNFLAKNRVR